MVETDFMAEPACTAAKHFMVRTGSMAVVEEALIVVSAHTVRRPDMRVRSADSITAAMSIAFPREATRAWAAFTAEWEAEASTAAWVEADFMAAADTDNAVFAKPS